MTAQAQELASSGDLESAQHLLGGVLAGADGDPGRASAELTTAAGLHARILVALGDPFTARSWAAFAYAAHRRLFGSADERTILATATLAAVLHRVGSDARAVQLYREVVAQLTAADGPDSLRVLAAQADLATVEHARGDCAVARVRLADAWRRYGEVHGEGEPAGIKMLARLGAMERSCGRFTEASGHFDLARQLCRQHLPAEHPMTAQIESLARAAATPGHVCRPPGGHRGAHAQDSPARSTADRTGEGSPGVAAVPAWDRPVDPTGEGAPGVAAVPAWDDPADPAPDPEPEPAEPARQATPPDPFDPGQAPFAAPRQATPPDPFDPAAEADPAGPPTGPDDVGGAGSEPFAPPGQRRPGPDPDWAPEDPAATDWAAGQHPAAQWPAARPAVAGADGWPPEYRSAEPAAVPLFDPAAAGGVPPTGPEVRSPAWPEDPPPAWAEPPPPGGAENPPPAWADDPPGRGAGDRPAWADDPPGRGAGDRPAWPSAADGGPTGTARRSAPDGPDAGWPAADDPAGQHPHWQDWTTRPGGPTAGRPPAAVADDRLDEPWWPPDPAAAAPLPPPVLDDLRAGRSAAGSGRGPGHAIEVRRARDRLPVPLYRPPTERRRPAAAVVAGLGAAALGTVAVVAGLVMSGDDDRRADPAAPPPSAAAPPATVAPTGSPDPPVPAAPADVTLRDTGDSVSLAWAYPDGAEGPVLISGGRAGQQLRAFQELPPGSDRYVVYALNERADYCFTISVVYSADSVASTEAVCTRRTGTSPAG